VYVARERRTPPPPGHRSAGVRKLAQPCVVSPVALPRSRCAHVPVFASPRCRLERKSRQDGVLFDGAHE